MKKNLSLAILGLVAMFGIGVKANAAVSATASTATLSCNKTTINIGESTVCKVSITPVLDGSGEYVSATSIVLAPSQYLKITDITPNSTAGFTRSTASSNNTYSFSTTQTGATTGKTVEVFSFTATLSEEAKNLSSLDDCAQICIEGVSLITNLSTTPEYLQPNSSGNVGTCYNPVVTEQTCQGDDCNPKTGAFMNVAVATGIGVVAIGAIVLARKSNKFYRV